MSNVIVTRQEKVTLPILYKVGLFVVGLLASLMLMFAFSSAAHAAPCAPGDNMCGVTSDPGNPGGNGNPGGSGGGSSNPGPKPPDQYVYTPPRTNSNFNFVVNCSNWSGAGSWIPSASCNTTQDAVLRAQNSAPAKGWGEVAQNGAPGITDFIGGMSCGPIGAKSGYAQNWSKQVAVTNVQQYTWVLAGTQGWVRVPWALQPVGASVYYTFLGCAYPVDSYQYLSCFYNYGGTAYYSPDRTRAFAGWSNFGPRPALASDPRPPSGGTGQTPPSCDRTGSAYVYFGKNPDQLGYYAMHVTYTYRNYTDLQWSIPGGRVLYNQWTRSGPIAGSATTWWAFSCRPGVALNQAVEGAFNSQGSLPNRDAYLNPATCYTTSWQCVLTTQSTVGLDRNAVAAGTVNPKTGVTVMRNGEQIPVTFATVKIVDTSTAADIDVTNGQSSPSVQKINSISYVDNVKPGSTPFNGTDPNAGNQYFKFFTAPGSTTTESFGTYYLGANQNVNKAISFYWASDSAAQPFAMQRQWKVDGVFRIPLPSGIGSSAGTGGGGYTYKQGQYDCHSYTGRGANRVDKGILVSETNPITVVRATNQ